MAEIYDNADYPLCLEVRNIVFKNNEATYAYSSEFKKRRFVDCDVMAPDKFEREHQRNSTSLKEKTSQYSEALNSVIYFATLPHNQDASVNRN
jgi:hypothetical protein